MTTKAENLKTRPDLDDETWLAWTAAQPENRGIHVRELYRKMLEWCMQKGVTPTRRRFLKWLDTEREAMPLTYQPPHFDPKPGTPEEPEKPDCDGCKNERFVSVVVNPDAQFEYDRTRMEPCPKCNADLYEKGK